MSDNLSELAQQTKAVYRRQAHRFDAERIKDLAEQKWLDRFLPFVGQGDHVLDLGCGSGRPVAEYVISQGYELTGVDFSPEMLDIARKYQPLARWLPGDIRTLSHDRCYAGIIAWDSFFHLTQNEQRDALPRLANHLMPDAPLLLTVGPRAGEVTGIVGEEQVYHASLSPEEYHERLEALDLTIRSFVTEDPACYGHSVLLAQKNK